MTDLPTLANGTWASLYIATPGQFLPWILVAREWLGMIGSWLTPLSTCQFTVSELAFWRPRQHISRQLHFRLFFWFQKLVFPTGLGLSRLLHELHTALTENSMSNKDGERQVERCCATASPEIAGHRQDHQWGHSEVQFPILQRSTSINAIHFDRGRIDSNARELEDTRYTTIITMCTL